MALSQVNRHLRLLANACQFLFPIGVHLSESTALRRLREQLECEEFEARQILRLAREVHPYLDLMIKEA